MRIILIRQPHKGMDIIRIRFVYDAQFISQVKKIPDTKWSQSIKTWLFEGIKGKQYSATSIANIVKQSAEEAGIHKHVKPHTLRHSFVNHNLEMVTDLQYIQK